MCNCSVLPAGEAWSWFLQAVLPTLSLMIGAVVTRAFTKSHKENIKVDRYAFVLAILLSVVYFFAVITTVLAQPFSEMSSIDLMNISSLWLSPIQAFATASLGLFFMKSIFD